MLGTNTVCDVVNNVFRRTPHANSCGTNALKFNVLRDAGLACHSTLKTLTTLHNSTNDLVQLAGWSALFCYFFVRCMAISLGRPSFSDYTAESGFYQTFF
jgi:hypothetical protein